MSARRSGTNRCHPAAASAVVMKCRREVILGVGLPWVSLVIVATVDPIQFLSEGRVGPKLLFPQHAIRSENQPWCHHKLLFEYYLAAYQALLKLFSGQHVLYANNMHDKHIYAGEMTR